MCVCNDVHAAHVVNRICRLGHAHSDDDNNNDNDSFILFYVPYVVNMRFDLEPVQCALMFLKHR